MTHRTWFAVVGLATFVAAAAPGATAAEPPSVTRLAGTDRYATAAEVSDDAFADRQVGRVWMARGDLFPDALAVACTAGAFNGGEPLLLTRPDGLPASTADHLDDLAPSEVVLVGDEEAITAGVEDELRARGLTVRRIAGVDRYATARQLAATAPTECVGTALLATGQDFADALVAAPMAYRLGMPIVLTTADELHPAARDALEGARATEVLILGGHDAISSRVEEQVRDLLGVGQGSDRVRRLAGRTRTETATRVADEFLMRTGASPTHVNLARGDVFADAAVGGPHAGQENAVILLTEQPDRLGDATRRWLQTHADQIETIHVFGSPDAVTDRVVEDARTAAAP